MHHARRCCSTSGAYFGKFANYLVSISYYNSVTFIGGVVPVEKGGGGKVEGGEGDGIVPHRPYNPGPGVLRADCVVWLVGLPLVPSRLGMRDAGE